MPANTQTCSCQAMRNLEVMRCAVGGGLYHFNRARTKRKQKKTTKRKPSTYSTPPLCLLYLPLALPTTFTLTHILTPLPFLHPHLPFRPPHRKCSPKATYIIPRPWHLAAAVFRKRPSKNVMLCGRMEGIQCQLVTTHTAPRLAVRDRVVDRYVGRCL